MALFAFAFALVVLSVLVVALLIGPSPAPEADGREIDDPPTDQDVEELTREKLYGHRRNVSRS